MDTVIGVHEGEDVARTLPTPDPSLPGRGVAFTGYAALFGRVDRAGDAFASGAFADAGFVPLLWQHRGSPVGVIETIAEDPRGLRVTGRIDDPGVAALVQSGALRGLSVGYRAVAAKQGAWRVVSRADLVEVSLVAQPMQPGARITSVMPAAAEICAFDPPLEGEVAVALATDGGVSPSR